MGDVTGIDWCDSTINVWIGCTELSPACNNCYARSLATRFAIQWNAPPQRTKEASWGKIETYQRGAARWFTQHGRRRRVFINSLSDFFDNQADGGWRMAACDRMAAASDVIFILVTKRPQNVLKMVPRGWMRGGWPENIWLLTTVENQEEADRRIPFLLAAANDCGIGVAGLSMEPLLERVRIGTKTLSLLQWIIFGGESGRKARPMREAWIENLMELAMALEPGDGKPRPAVFVKQLSEHDHPKGAYKNFGTFPPALQVREFPKS